MKLSTSKILLVSGVLVIIWLSVITWLSLCTKYSNGREVKEVSGLSTGGIVLPRTLFDYYKKDQLRYRGYVLYFKDQSFFDLNKSSLILTLKDVKIKRGTSWDPATGFEESSYSPPFDYNLDYEYVQFKTGDPLIQAEGLTNKEHRVYILKIKNDKSGPD